MNKHVPYGLEHCHRQRLIRGLRVLGHDFLAQRCYWCDGYTTHNLETCSVCMHNGAYSSLGLLQGGKPAPYSVVNQVLVAADRCVEIPLFDPGECDDTRRT